MFDLIITDQPYGFNADHEAEMELASIYNGFLTAAVRALRNQDQLCSV